jgi:prepilin-type N-terminal cleavage/methylation domain-containing protein
MINQVLPRSSRGVRGGEPRCNAFTLIELVLVVGIITVLSGLVLTTVGYARKKGARARAETEIAAMSAAIENYKADNSVYPNNPATNGLDARTMGNPTGTTDPTYNSSSVDLYVKLSGDINKDRNPTGKSYMSFKPNMLLPPGGSGTVIAIADPFGNSYGYSTAANPQANPTPSGTPGYNPTFDLWTTCTLTNSPPTAADQNQWIKNW